MMKFLKDKSLWKYLISAIIIVCFELLIFQLLYLLNKNYFIATTSSFVIAVIFNWLISRFFVFSGSKFKAVKELTLVATASVIGLCIQLSVVYISVEKLLIIPVIAKTISIFFSFLWNYWFRAKYIFIK